MGDVTKIKDLPTNITTLLEAIVKFSKYLVIPTAVTTFFPDSWLQHMNLLSIKNSIFGMWISVAFWICISVVIIDMLQKLLTILFSIYNSKKLKRNLAKTMESLTKTEKDIVYKIFIYDNYRFNVLADAAVKKLKDQGIIFHSNMGNQITGFSCGLQPMAREYLNENPNYLEEHAKLCKKSLVTELDKLKKSMSDLSQFDYDSVTKRETIEQLEKN
ncbi:super-infection exclusion protein B [Enterococcus hirae]|uniref:super-infection exclusion protein B n=1 Tax=Enterococcus hirae TaxID=1354 RepID=UPI001094B2DB|nr:super-infection exclusion protein B [Enterococcus hirae]MDL4889384.1 super-infection exclusion protein B [Enterococcus hirae]MDL4892050.1 super-infection exclusion protein B [Enterococcus hirae]MDL4898187.1 super-infection exclusion protein B [Enterococcus hirae]MDL4900687.1 super-infection exclusion protein B [Enterococcus hirae]MDL4903407.1 super-infection exclusion protein B [Enterococcus hirae]